MLYETARMLHMRSVATDRPDFRIYYTDSYLSRFEARVIESQEGGQRIYLEQTTFYPTSAG